MFGIGKLASGLLSSIGLGKLGSIVSLGLNAMTGNWLGVAQDVMGLVSQFKGGQDNAGKQPPLGNFGSNPFTSENNPLKQNRFQDIFKGFKSLLNGFKSLMGGDAFGGLGKIFDAFSVLNDSFSNNQLLNNRVSNSQYNSITA